MNPILQQNIMKDLGLDALPQDQQEQALQGISKIIFQSVIIKLLEKMNDEDAAEFEKVMEANMDNEEVVLSFLQSKFPDLDNIVSGEIAKFKQEGVDFMKQTQN